MSGELVKTFDPKKVVISFNGFPITGFVDGTFIEVAPAADRFTKSVGADGEVARVHSSNNTHEVTITLLQTSPSNDVLSAQAEADRLSGLGAGPLQINDLSGTTLFFWASAWIKTPATWSGGNDGISERAWVFDTAQAIAQNVGGNL
jgi:hypothetical protein